MGPGEGVSWQLEFVLQYGLLSGLPFIFAFRMIEGIRRASKEMLR